MPTEIAPRRQSGGRRPFGFGRLVVFMVLVIIAHAAGWLQLAAIGAAERVWRK